MRYFDFDALNHKWESIEPFLMVALVYLIILAVAWLYTRFAPR